MKNQIKIIKLIRHIKMKNQKIIILLIMRKNQVIKQINHLVMIQITLKMKQTKQIKLIKLKNLQKILKTNLDLFLNKYNIIIKYNKP